MSACLALSVGDGTRRVLVDRPLVVGRDLGCDLHFDDARMSRRHVRVIPADGRVRVRDLGSRNGTFVNGRIVKDAHLAHGDVLQVGQISLRCHAPGTDELDGPDTGETPLDTRSDLPVTRLLSRVRSGGDHGSVAADAPQSGYQRPRAGLRAAARILTAALRREPARFASSHRFIAAWRRQMVAAWLIAGLAVLSVPSVWVWNAVGRQDGRQARLAAGWLAAAAIAAEDGIALDALAATVMRVAGVASVTFLDEHCLIVSPSARAGTGDPSLGCTAAIPAQPTSWQDGELTIGAARVVQSGPGRASMVMTKSSAPAASTMPFWLMQAAVLLVVSLMVWIAAGWLCGRVVALLDAFAENASTTVRGGAGRLGSGHALPALDRIAGIVDFLMIRREPPADAPEGTEGTAAATPAASLTQAVSSPAVPAPALAPVHAALVVSNDFTVERTEGDVSAFGLNVTSPGRHILDVLQGQTAVTNTVLAMLAGHASCPEASRRAEVCATGAGVLARVELVVAGARLELRLTREDHTGPSK